MNEPPAKGRSLFDQIRSMSIRTWVIVLLVETVVLLALLTVLLWVILK